MKRFITGFILGACSIPFLVYATTISAPPPFKDIPASLQHYLKKLYDNLHSPPVTTTAPDNSRRGRDGTVVFYNNSGTYEFWVKDNVDSTSWQKIGP